MKQILFISVLCCTTLHAADNAQQYTFAPYDNEHDHDTVFALFQQTNPESNFPVDDIPKIDKQKLTEKTHRKLNDGTSFNEYPGGLKPCPRFTFRTADEKKQVVGYTLFFTRTDTGKGLIDELKVDKNHTDTLYLFIIATILNKMHNEMKVPCVTFYERNQETRDAHNQIVYEQYIKAGFTEATQDIDEETKAKCIRLEHTAKI
jgi:hypothetical protein